MNISTIFRPASASVQTSLCEELLNTKLFVNWSLFRFKLDFLQTSFAPVGISKALSIAFVNISQSLMDFTLVAAL